MKRAKNVSFRYGKHLRSVMTFRGHFKFNQDVIAVTSSGKLNREK